MNQADAHLKLIKFILAQNHLQLNELGANMHKGDPIEYAERKDLSTFDFMKEIIYHVDKLKSVALQTETDKELLTEYCADVCNCVLFLMINQKLI